MIFLPAEDFKMKRLHRLSYRDAFDLALKEASVERPTETIFIDKALGRVLAQDINVVKNLPSFDNAAMDGFAFRHEERGERLHVVAKIFAGEKSEPILKKASCYKIMTGAKIPEDANTIAPFEMCTVVDNEYIIVPREIKKGNAFRVKGEEKQKGTTLFSKLERITPAHIALMATQGITAIKVFKRLEIAVVSTGSEIKEPWEEADEDEIYNANAFAIIAQLQKYGFKTRYAGVIPDSLDKSISFIDGLKDDDVIITTGGISMGDADFIQEAFVKNGLEILFHGVEIKPGRASMMGKMDKTFVMAMPGNPLAAMLNVYLLAIPILTKMQGNSAYYHPFVYANNIETFHLKAGRTNVVLGNFSQGEFRITRENRYGSGMLTPLVESNAMLVLGADISLVSKGETVKVVLFDNLANETRDGILNG